MWCEEFLSAARQSTKHEINRNPSIVCQFRKWVIPISENAHRRCKKAL